MTLQLGMVVLDVTDLESSIAFYRLLGLEFPDPFPDRPVARHTMESGVSMLLVRGFAAQVDPGWVRPEGYQQVLEFYVGDDEAVDETWHRLTAAGHLGRTAPLEPDRPLRGDGRRPRRQRRAHLLGPRREPATRS